MNGANYDHKVLCTWKNASLISACTFNFPDIFTDFSSSIIESLNFETPIKLIIENDFTLKLGDLNFLISIQQCLHLLNLVTSQIYFPSNSINDDSCDDDNHQILDYYCISHSLKFFSNINTLFINLSAPNSLPNSPFIINCDSNTIETCIGYIPLSILFYNNSEVVAVRNRFCTISLKSINLQIDSNFLKSLNNFEILSFKSTLCAPICVEFSERNVNAADICSCFQSNSFITPDFILPEEEKSDPLVNFTLTNTLELDHWKNSKSILSFSIAVKGFEFFWNLRKHIHLLAFNYFLDKLVEPFNSSNSNDACESLILKKV